MSDPASRAQQRQSVSGNDRCRTAEPVVHSNLDLADCATVLQDGHAIVRKRRAGAEVDVIVFRLGRPVPSKVELGAVADQPTAAMTAGAEAIGWQAPLIQARTQRTSGGHHSVDGAKNAADVHGVVGPGATSLYVIERSAPSVTEAGRGRCHPVHHDLTGEVGRGENDLRAEGIL